MEEENIKPVNINEDVWFYPVDDHFEFVVYSKNREVTQFNITKKKLKKYFI